MVAVGYKAHTILQHAAQARLDVPRLFTEILKELQDPRAAASAAGDGG